jgi:hypothetical protein
MKIILKNADVECTTNNSKQQIQILIIAITYKECYPLNIELQKLK